MPGGPKKQINLISSIENGAGLERDTNIMAAVLESMGHKWRKIAYDRPFAGLSYHADINIFLEVMVAGLLNYAPVNWLMPNSEWWDFHAGESSLPRINLILCKTHDCERIWGSKTGRTHYLDFEALDMYDGSNFANKNLEFLHLAGNSGTKNTEAVIDAWRMYGMPFPVTIVSRDPAIRVKCHGICNVKYEQRLADSHVAAAINQARFHLMPSQYEGYGQGMHEAMGCGGIVLTTDAPPMTEFDGIPRELMIPSTGTFIRRLATCHYVSPEGVRDAVLKAAVLSPERCLEMAQNARNAFLRDRECFRQRLATLLG